MVMHAETVRPELACTIRALNGAFIEAEPEIGRWYASVDNRQGKHVLGLTAKYLGEGDFLSTAEEYLEDACSVLPGVYLLLLRHQDPVK